MDDCAAINIFLISGNAIQAFGNGTDVGVWQPQPPIEPTAAQPSITGRKKDQSSNALDALTDLSKLDMNSDSLYPVCGTSQVKLPGCWPCVVIMWFHPSVLSSLLLMPIINWNYALNLSWFGRSWVQGHLFIIFI